MWKFLFENVDVLALILAILAFGITIWSVSLQRDHNRKSLRPYPDIVLADYENRLAVSLHNKGLGPLTIKEVKIYENQDLLENKNLISLMPDLPKSIDWRDFIEKIEGRVLAAGEEKIFLELVGDDRKSNFRKARKLVRKSLMNLKIQISYKGIYEDKFPLCERELDWFGRTI